MLNYHGVIELVDIEYRAFGEGKSPKHLCFSAEKKDASWWLHSEIARKTKPGMVITPATKYVRIYIYINYIMLYYILLH